MSGTYYEYRGRGSLQDHSSLRYGDLDYTQRTSGEDVVFIDNYLSAGDYSGNDGGIIRSNVDYWNENFGESEGRFWWSLSGGHGSFGVAVLADVLDAQSALVQGLDEDDAHEAERIREAIESVDSYPLLDESAYSEFEVNLQNEQFAEAAEDVYTGGRRASFAQLLASLVMDNLRIERDQYGRQQIVQDRNNRTEAEEEAAAEAYTLEAIQHFYFTLGDAFGIYPYTEGSGDNVSVIFSFDDFIIRLAEVLEALAPQLGAVLRQKLDTALRGDWRAVDVEFKYQQQGYHLVRLGLDLQRQHLSLTPSTLKLLDPSLDDHQAMVLMDMVLESDPALVRAAFTAGTLVQQLMQGMKPLQGVNVLSGLLNRWKS